MASLYAKKLLAEVQTEDLDKLLLSVHNYTTEQNPQHLGIAELDAILRPYLQRRHASDPSTATAFPMRDAAGPHPQHAHPPIIEVVGTGPCAGKTQLLYRIAAELLLGMPDASAEGQRPRPASESSDAADDPCSADEQLPDAADAEITMPTVGVSGGVVIWMDCAQSYDIQRQHRVLQSSAAARCPFQPAHPSVLHAASETLAHLHIYRPPSFEGLLSMLKSLPSDYHGSGIRRGTDLSSNHRIAAVIISSVSTFLPFERAAAAYGGQETDLLGSTPASATPSTPSAAYAILDARFRVLLASLRSAQTAWGCPVITTRSAGPPSLPVVWARAVDARVQLRREEWRRRVAKGVSVLEALAIEHKSRAAIDGQEQVDIDQGQEVAVEGIGQTIGLEGSAGRALFSGNVAGRGREETAFDAVVDDNGWWMQPKRFENE